MENHFEICMAEDQLRGISSIGLAHMGDAVFELLVRGWLCQHGKATGKGLHQATIQLVRAEHQAACAEKILPLLTEAELAGAATRRYTPSHSTPAALSTVRPRRWRPCSAGCTSAASDSGPATFLRR